MSTNLSINSFFDPDPVFYLTGLKVLGVIGMLIGVFSLYVLIVRGPRKSTLVFRVMVVYHIVLGILFQVTLTLLAPPRIYLPYIASDFPGIYSMLNIPPEIQLELLLSSILAAASCISPLFYYRMDNLIDKDHFLNNVLFRTCFYVFIYLICPALPIFAVAMCVQDQKEVKTYLVESFGIHYDRFYSPEVVAFRFDFSNIWAILFALGFCGGTIVANLMILFCSYIIYWTFAKKTKGIISETKAKQQKALKVSLTSSGYFFQCAVAMSNSMPTNPYFTPEPVVYLTGLKVLGAIGVIVGLFGLYILIFRSPKRVKFSFKFLIGYHIIVAILFQLTLTILAPPRIYLPYIALDFPGIYTMLKVPSDIQLELLLSSIVAAAACIVPLFYYRMSIILPASHYFNKFLLRMPVYIVTYIIFPVLPIIAITMSVQDQNEVKTYLVESFGIRYDRFYSPEVIAFRFDFSNIWAILCAIGFFGGTLAANSLTIFCSYIIYWTFYQKTKGIISDSKAKQKKALTISLTSSILVIMAIIAFIMPTVAFLLMTNSYRADIMNITILLGACAFPFALITFYLAYPPYRKTMFEMVLGKKKNMCNCNNTSGCFSLKLKSVLYV